jgi:AGCS family alanine or glycine:cation symporter
MIKFLIRKSKNSVLLFRILFLVFIYLGGIFQMDPIWKFSETMNALMAIPNLISLILLSGVIVKETKEFFARFQLANKRKK